MSEKNTPPAEGHRATPDAVRVLVMAGLMLLILLLAFGPLHGVQGLVTPSKERARRGRGTETPSSAPATTPAPSTTAPAATSPRPPTPGLKLRHQTMWIPPSGGNWQADIALDGLGRSPAYELAVTVHQRVSNREDLDRTFAGERLLGQSRGGSFVTPLPSVPVNARGELSVTVPTRGPESPYVPNSVLINRPGIYPVSLEVRTVEEGRTMFRLVTHLVALDAVPVQARLGVATIVAVEGPPLSDAATGRSQPPGSDELAALGRTAAALPPRTLTIAPGGETTEALAGLPGAPLVPWEQAANRNQVLSGPFVSVDPATLGATARTELPQQLQVGRRSIESTLRVAPDATLWMDHPTDPHTLAALADRGTTRMVLPEDALTPAAKDTPDANRRPFALNLPGRAPVTTVAVDRRQTDRLEKAGTESVQAAYQVLTDLAAEATLPTTDAVDDPSRASGAGSGRGVVVAPTRRIQMNPAALAELGGALNASPVLRPMTVDDVFKLPGAQALERSRSGEVRPTGPLSRTALTPATSPNPELESATVRARATWTVTSQVMEVPGRSWEKQILAAQSDRLSPPERLRRLNAVTTELEDELAKVQLQRSSNLSLTAAEGAVPINVVNDTGRAVRVRVQVSSPKLDFPEGDARTLELDRRSTNVLIPVRARTSGNIPLTVVLTTPDGNDQLASSDDYRLRATGLPGIGYALIGGALAVLGLWWIRVVRRTGRLGRLAAEHGEPMNEDPLEHAARPATLAEPSWVKDKSRTATHGAAKRARPPTRRRDAAGSGGARQRRKRS